MAARLRQEHIQIQQSPERAMVNAYILSIITLWGIAAWAALCHLRRRRQIRRQQEIVRRGACCTGKVVAIQRPSLVDTCTRLYFDFEPPGAGRPLRACHIDRASAGRLPNSLPYIGQLVSVRYLRERPRDALISSLHAS